MTHILEWLKVLKLTIPSVDKNMEELELSYTPGGTVKRIQLL